MTEIASKPGWGSVRFARRFLLVLLGSLAVGRSMADRIYRQDPEYLIENWNIADGMPESSATAMAQTADGYLWFGTFGGLVRFNGTTFQLCTVEENPGYVGGGVVNLYYDRNDRLWVSTLDGFSVLEKGQWRTLTAADGWTINYVRSFAEDPNGDLLMSGFDGQLLLWSGGKLERWSNPGAKGQGYFTVSNEPSGWWVVQNRFMGRWNSGAWQERPLTKELEPAQLAASRSQEGGMWLLEGELLRKFKGEEEVWRTTIPQAPRDYWSISEDRKGQVWICTDTEGLLRISPDRTVRRWTTANGLAASTLRFASEDREGNIWVGSNGGGLHKFTARRFLTILPGNDASPPNFTSVSRRAAGGVWLGSYGNGLFQVEGNQSVAAPVAIPSLPRVIQSVLEDRSGRLWIGSYERGITCLEHGMVRSFPAGECGGGNGISLFEDSQGRIWTSGGQAVAVYEGGTFRIAGPEKGLPPGAVPCFGQASGGELFAAHDQGLFLCRDQLFEPVKDSRGALVQGVIQLCPDPDTGSMWMVTRDGSLLRWQVSGISRIPPAAGLPPEPVQGLLDDGLGHVWMMTAKGTVRADWKDLRDAADGRGNVVPSLLLNVEDGLPGLEFSRGRQPMATLGEDGRLWFPMLWGAAVLQASTFMPDPVPPPVHVEQLSWLLGAGGETVDREVRTKLPASVAVSLPAGSRRLEFAYSALSYAAPGKVRYQVKMEGRQNRWQDMLQDRTANYLELPHGQYTFRVRASNRDGIWNETGAAIAFTIQPYLWETLWFRFGAGLLLVAAGGTAVWAWARVHHRHLRERLEANQQRAEIAHLSRVVTLSELSGSLAHELNQPLAIILSNAQAAQRILRQDPLDLKEVREILSDIVSEDRRAGKVIQRLRALLKRGESHQALEDLNVLVEEVLMLTRQEFMNRGVVVSCNFSRPLKRILGDRVQLQQVVLNLVTNACDSMISNPPGERHLQLVTTSDENVVRLAVIDQGCGIPIGDPEHIFKAFVTTKNHGMGLGLSISRSIVLAHHGSLTAERHSGRGSTFLLTLPVALPS